MLITHALFYKRRAYISCWAIHLRSIAISPPVVCHDMSWTIGTAMYTSRARKATLLIRVGHGDALDFCTGDGCALGVRVRMGYAAGVNWDQSHGVRIGTTVSPFDCSRDMRGVRTGESLTNKPLWLASSSKADLECDARGVFVGLKIGNPKALDCEGPLHKAQNTGQAEVDNSYVGIFEQLRSSVISQTLFAHSDHSQPFGTGRDACDSGISAWIA
eukprot:IDg2733t1